MATHLRSLNFADEGVESLFPHQLEPGFDRSDRGNGYNQGHQSTTLQDHFRCWRT